MPKQLPSPKGTKYDYVMYEDVRIPMRDGTELSACIFFPAKDGIVDFDRKYPVILNRSAYVGVYGPIISDYPYHMIGYATQNGFAFVLNSVRGTFKSEGEFDPMRPEGLGEKKDGTDTVAWIIKQPWSDGRVITTGASYLGGTQYAMILNGDVPGLETCIMQVPAVNAFGNGWIYTDEFFDTNSTPAWGIQMALEPNIQSQLSDEAKKGILEDIPLLGDPRFMNVPKLLTKYSPKNFPVARRIPFYQRWLEHRDDPS